jgi:Fic-DOC domain mobile mystery protein B
MTEPSEAGGDATPLTLEERGDLIPTHITLRSELNELEQQNIAAADRWAFSRRRKVLDEGFLRGLHRRMFNRVWRWAGKYRKTERNIGIESHRIETELYQVIDDAQYWIEQKSYPPDELAVRFHHRLVVVHPFPNGNGRWSRLAADLLIVAQGSARFTLGPCQSAGRGQRAARVSRCPACRGQSRYDSPRALCEVIDAGDSGERAARSASSRSAVGCPCATRPYDGLTASARCFRLPVSRVTSAATSRAAAPVAVRHRRAEEVRHNPDRPAPALPNIRRRDPSGRRPVAMPSSSRVHKAARRSPGTRHNRAAVRQ